jgi:hypothetical protein
MHFLQAFAAHVRVYLGGADARMPEHLLNDPQVRPIIQQMSGKAVAQHMRRDVSIDPATFHPLLNAQPECHSRKGCSALREKEICWRTTCHQLLPSRLQIALNALDGAASNGHNALLVPFADHVNESRIQMKLLQTDASQLGKAQAGGIGKLHNRIFAEGGSRRGLRGAQQALDLSGAQVLRQPLPAFWQRKVFRNVFREDFFILAEFIKRAKGRDSEINGAAAEFLFRILGCSRDLSFLLLKKERRQVRQFDRTPVANPVLFRPANKPAEKSGIGALCMLGLAALVPQILQEILNQLLHAISAQRSRPVIRL